MQTSTGTWNYFAMPCSYQSLLDCPEGFACRYAHRVQKEPSLHPTIYKTQLCEGELLPDGSGCKEFGPHCTKAHGYADLRKPLYDAVEIAEGRGQAASAAAAAAAAPAAATSISLSSSLAAPSASSSIVGAFTPGEVHARGRAGSITDDNAHYDREEVDRDHADYNVMEEYRSIMPHHHQPPSSSSASSIMQVLSQPRAGIEPAAPNNAQMYPPRASDGEGSANREQRQQQQYQDSSYDFLGTPSFDASARSDVFSASANTYRPLPGAPPPHMMMMMMMGPPGHSGGGTGGPQMSASMTTSTSTSTSSPAVRPRKPLPVGGSPSLHAQHRLGHGVNEGSGGTVPMMPMMMQQQQQQQQHPHYHLYQHQQHHHHHQLQQQYQQQHHHYHHMHPHAQSQHIQHSPFTSQSSLPHRQVDEAAYSSPMPSSPPIMASWPTPGAAGSAGGSGSVGRGNVGGTGGGAGGMGGTKLGGGSGGIPTGSNTFNVTSSPALLAAHHQPAVPASPVLQGGSGRRYPTPQERERRGLSPFFVTQLLYRLIFITPGQAGTIWTHDDVDLGKISPSALSAAFAGNVAPDHVVDISPELLQALRRHTLESLMRACYKLVPPPPNLGRVVVGLQGAILTQEAAARADEYWQYVCPPNEVCTVAQQTVSGCTIMGVIRACWPIEYAMYLIMYTILTCLM